MSDAARPTVQEAGPAERGDQARLYATCFGKDDGQRVLPWRYDGCPHGQPVTLLARLADGTPISGYACSPRRVLVRGDRAGATPVGQTGDVMTDPAQRGKGVFSDLDRRAMEATAARGWPLVYGLPNRVSADLFTDKLGWSQVGRIRPWTFVLTADAGARAERLRAGRLASMAVPFSAWRGSMRRGALRKAFFAKVNVVALPRFTSEVDGVLEAVAADWDWMVERDHRFLNWRFADAPSGRFRAHGVYQPDGAMRGYCVVQLPARGERVGFVADLLAVDDVAFAAALEAALGHLHKAGASVARAYAVEGSWWEGRLRAAGFRAGKADDWKKVIAYVHDPAHPLAALAREPRRWYFTDADRDDELVG